MKTTSKFLFFWQGIYSNWSASAFKMDGKQFVNAEQAFMWQKARFFGDDEVAEKILLDSTPNGVKALGRRVKNYNDEKWSDVRFIMMYDACLAKFKQNPALKTELLATGSLHLVEASPYDKVWGIGMAENDAGVEDEANWKGLNLLGKALGIVRENLT